MREGRDHSLSCPCSCLPIADGGEDANELSFSVDGVGDLPPDNPLRLQDDARDLSPGAWSALALPHTSPWGVKWLSLIVGGHGGDQRCVCRGVFA